MIIDPEKTIIDRERKITIFADSYELAESLRTMTTDSFSETDYYHLREAANHIESMYESYKSLLFLRASEIEKSIFPRRNIYIKSLNLSVRLVNCITSTLNKDYDKITLLDIETASLKGPVSWKTVKGLGERCYRELSTIMNENSFSIE